MRNCKITPNVNPYAEGSCVIEMGQTKVLCTASVDENTPSWLKEKKQGWLTAEYSMLPRATHTRTKRDREKVSGRTQEIQRLIGRALRASVDLAKLGERQIIVDCDVLQADGGTRTASITGACVAVGQAIQKLEREGKVPANTFINTIQAISVGMKNKEVLVDLNYEQDSTCDVDMNFVRTGTDEWIEIQGTAEKKSFNQTELLQMMGAATQALDEIKKIQESVLQQLK